jgi:glycerate kinase
VFASDSFKGTLSSARASELLADAAKQVLPGAELVAFQIADGGEGTLDAICAARDGEREAFPAHDGLMRPIEGEVLICDGKAFVEAASTCGLAMLEKGERNPLATTSYGVGECIRHALDRGCDEVVVGLGGSCTNDGGMGCLRALGVRFLDDAGRELGGTGKDLGDVAQIDESGLHPRVGGTTFTIMGDVDNPLLGPSGATWVFGRQKGADDAAIEGLEQGMAHLSKAIAANHPGTDFSTPGFGAAGGLGMALSVFLGARIRSGIEELLSIIGFDEAVEGADLVVTGEGRFDGQSLRGKAVSGIVAHANSVGVPVAAICGSVELEGRDLRSLGLTCLIDASEGQELDYALSHAEGNYREAAVRLFSSLRDGRLALRT